ncbi:MAG: ribonuclease HI family protein [Armatimonadota bacterium]|nr:ribonuclease HI family protein [Armatimonadota bacterium]
MEKLILHIDGASKGNPGAAGIGVVLSDGSGHVLREISEYIGNTTNNVAEYTALLRGLEEALALGARSAQVMTDSQLLAFQLDGRYKIKAPHLRRLNEAAKALMAKFRRVSVSHVPREQNAAADRLASRAAERLPCVEEPEPEAENAGQQSLGL